MKALLQTDMPERYFWQMSNDERMASRINMAKGIIAQDFSDNLEMKIVARQVGLNYSYFRKMFKKFAGVSPLSFAEELRMKKSKELLAKTDLTSQQVAYSVGFNTPYYFCLFFKKRTGMSPLEFRKKYQEM